MITEIEPNLIISSNELFDAPPGVRLCNYQSGVAFKFYCGSRKNAVTELIAHESNTRSLDDTVKVLDRKKNQNGKPYTLGVHFLVDADGGVTQHGDMALSWQQHYGAPHNQHSVALEIVNPYEPRHLSAKLPWKRVIDAPWAHGGQYVVPTHDQAEAFHRMLCWIVDTPGTGVEIPNIWHGYDAARNRFALSRVTGLDKVRPGIMSHQQIGKHADGSWPLLYSFLRRERGIASCMAYEVAIQLATGAKSHAQLGDIDDMLARS